MDHPTLVSRIEERLRTLGKDPTPLGHQIGKGRDFVSDILKGRKKTIPNDVLTPLAIALECDERYFTDSAFASPGRPRRPVTSEAISRYADAAKGGYYAWAWRDFRRLTLQDVAAESGLTPGTVSDIEQGLMEPTSDQLSALAKAFGTNAGMLQANPFETDQRVARLVSITEDLDPADQATLIDMAEALQRRRAI